MIVLHDNIDKLAMQIIQAVEARANILQMITKAKGSYAVTMVDFQKPSKDCSNSLCLADEVDAMQGVIKVRVIH
ncbi:MAG: hypothetical protein MZU97_26625 [Bacillus subtilis]|nr:hypothetical protein [Bacillus subtilis]